MGIKRCQSVRLLGLIPIREFLPVVLMVRHGCGAGATPSIRGSASIYYLTLLPQLEGRRDLPKNESLSGPVWLFGVRMIDTLSPHLQMGRLKSGKPLRDN